MILDAMPAARRRNCIFTSAGHKHNLKQWLEAGNRSWDLITVYYGDDETVKSELQSASDVFIARKGSKFQNLFACFKENGNIFDRYDHVWVMDDDLVITSAQIEQMFEIAARWDFWVCQPAFDPAGKISHAITAYNPATFLRIVDFVEVTCPLFRRDRLVEFLGHYDGFLVGWGIDFWIAHVLRSRDLRKFAVVDAVRVINPTDAAKGGVREIDTLQATPLRVEHGERVLAEKGIPMRVAADIAWIFDEADARALRDETARRISEVAALRGEIEHGILEANALRQELGRKNATFDALREEASHLAGQLAELTAAHEALLHSTSWRLTAPLRSLGSANPRLRTPLRRAARLSWWMLTLQLPRRLAAWRAARVAVAPAPPVEEQRPASETEEASGFDRDWYLTAYPEVAAAGVDPFEHYCAYGREEGRFPNGRFDAGCDGSDRFEAAASDGRAIVYFWPDYSSDNPYQQLMYGTLAARFAIRRGTIANAQAALERGAGNVVFHLHWTAFLLGSAGSRPHAESLLSAFLAQIERFVSGGGRLVWTVHNALPHEAAFPDLELLLCRRLSELAAVIHVHSARVPGLVADLYDLDPRKVVVGPHGSYIGSYENTMSPAVARERLDLPQAARVFLFIGYVRRYKGLDDLLTAFARIQEAGFAEPVYLVVAGSPFGVDPQELLALAGSLKNTVLHFRSISPGDMQIYLKAADFVVAPYRQILTSGSIYLSLSFGVPVIAPRLGLVPDVVTDGRNGILYDPGDRDGLYRALVEAIAMPRHVLESMAAQSLAHAETCTWDLTHQALAVAFTARNVPRPASHGVQSGDSDVSADGLRVLVQP